MAINDCCAIIFAIYPAAGDYSPARRSSMMVRRNKEPPRNQVGGSTRCFAVPAV